MKDIVTASHLNLRTGQPGFVVIETDHEIRGGDHTRVSFLFTADEAIDFAERMILLAHGATPATKPEGTE